MNKSVFLTEHWWMFLSNFIPNKLVTFNDKDPPWMTPNSREKINRKNSTYKDYIKNSETNYHNLQLQNVISEVSVAISRGKNEYHSRLFQKLSDTSASSKTYWSIWKIFFNRKKVPIIPLLPINNKLESDFTIKAHYFNSCFDWKCTPLINNSTVPSLLNYVSTVKVFSFCINKEVILKVVNAFNIDKADYISIRMMVLCTKSVVKSFVYDFNNFIDTGIFRDIWKRSNIIPFQRKGGKQIVDNYRRVSLLSIFGKKF